MKHFLKHMPFRFAITLGLMFLLKPNSSNAQYVSVNGLYVSTGSGLVVSVDTVNTNGSSTLANAGTLTARNIVNAGTLQGDGTYNISHILTNTGTFTAGNSTVNFNGTNQNINALTYYNLSLSGSNALKTASGNITVNAVLTINNTDSLEMGTYTLGGTLSSTAGTGLLCTQNTSATPLAKSKTWAMTILYNSVSAQTIIPGNYTSLNASNGNRTLDSTGTIGISGTFTPGAGTYITAGSTIDFNGSGAQTIPAFAFYNVTASGGNTKSLGGNISVKNWLTLGASTTFAIGNNYVTLKSDTLMTASLNAVPTTASITYGTGGFTVERYAAGRRKYRMITSSVTTSSNSTLSVGEESKSIWGNWQVSGSNATAGVGTFITGGSATNGFDTQLASASMYAYDGVNRVFKAFSTANGKNTKYTPLKAGVPYYLFIYGDRTQSVTSTNPHNTTLSATGQVLTGNQVYDSTTTVPISTTIDQYSLLGNPFAATIDWKSVQKSGVSKTIWAWDPNLNSTGGYVTVTDLLNGILIAPLSSAVKISQYVQPGQAFFVKTTGTNPKVTIREQDKVTSTITGVFRTTTANPLLAVNLLYTANSVTTLGDGAVVAFDQAYSINVDDDDVKKYAGANEVVSITRSGTALNLEARPYPGLNDTMFLNVQRMTKPVYTLEVFMQDIPAGAFTATLVDNYLASSTSLSLTDTNHIDVLRTADPNSYSASRFYIVFQGNNVLPVTFTSVRAVRQTDKIKVDWTVENQVNISKYQVERSSDGSHFNAVATQSANNDLTGNYTYTDVNPLNGDNFYRIKSIDKDGKISYSVIVKVRIDAAPEKITVSPNPIVGDDINVTLENIPVGNYSARIINMAGAVIATKYFNHSGGMQVYTIHIAGLPSGIYTLELTQPDNKKLSHKIVKQ
ncbi:MAG TPA: T9SS type A sorting domain-containing protein [Ferruginibacter sp.]|nr:T9SS type A sorting domain-containing protein [Ferruginibacter sp.]